jgi:hypothetical protein
MNISFSNAFYVFECSFNLINFDQLNDLYLMTYKFKIFIVENQHIITKKRVNNVFFLSCESMWITISSSHLSSIISRCRQTNQESRLIKKFWTCDILDSNIWKNKTCVDSSKYRKEWNWLNSLQIRIFVNRAS